MTIKKTGRIIGTFQRQDNPQHYARFMADKETVEMDIPITPEQFYAIKFDRNTTVIIAIDQ